MNLEEVKSIAETASGLFNASPVIAIVTLVVMIVIVVKTFTEAAEIVAKVVEWLRESFVWLFGLFRDKRERRSFIARRRQFLRVVASDLAVIGKAESWNDQQFTDLEAEVEIEGLYYASALRKLLRRKSSGLRREPSLMRAIERSSEKCLLLTGDPGSGKSVALRHLATQLAETYSKSGREKCYVPLYINLREMHSFGSTPIGADAIKSFVIDNVRRNDADTADYIRENWDNFKRNGYWFFLFDSFDEIPEVLHAAAGNGAVNTYGKAIQQFMDGLGECRGVLASREFKSPKTIVWPKLRILALNEQKQEELVRKTFLTESQKQVALRAVSLSSSATYRNPLFLSLLCRYVKDKSLPPSNEHQLLFSHLSSLANRDQDYVWQKWGFSPEDLLAAASHIAKLFAVSSELGLAPTIDEIVAANLKSATALPASKIVAIIEALTYVKIGRTDVASAETSVRRFAFSHRRYQECLFAGHLASNPDAIEVADLVSNSKWREYLVAMLQIDDEKTSRRILATAREILDKAGDRIKPRVRRFFGEELVTYAWSDETIDQVLSALLEAKRYVPDAPWGELGQTVEKVFGRFWTKGDYFDRLKITAYCGVGSPELLAKRLEFSSGSGITRLEEAAIDSCQFLERPSTEISEWVRDHVTARIVASRKRFEVLRWEAKALQLPNAFEVAVCVSRALSLNRRLRALSRVAGAVLGLLSNLKFSRFQSGSGALVGHRKVTKFIALLWLLCFYCVLLVAMSALPLLKGGLTMLEVSVVVLAAGLSISIVAAMIQLSFVAHPKRLILSYCLGRWLLSVKRSRRLLAPVGGMAIAFLAPGVALFWAARLFGWFPSQGLELVILGSGATYLVIASAFVASEILGRIRAQERAQSSLSGKTIFQALSNAENGEELLSVCRLARDSDDVVDARNSLAYLSAMLRIRMKASSRLNLPQWDEQTADSQLRSAISYLLEPLLKSRQHL